MPDSPQRIVTDTSQKLPIRFGETIKAYEASGTLQVDSLTLIPLVLAGWCRYLIYPACSSMQHILYAAYSLRRIFLQRRPHGARSGRQFRKTSMSSCNCPFPEES